MKRVAIGLIALATQFQSMVAVHPRFSDTFYQKQVDDFFDNHLAHKPSFQKVLLASLSKRLTKLRNGRRLPFLHKKLHAKCTSGVYTPAFVAVMAALELIIFRISAAACNLEMGVVIKDCDASCCTMAQEQAEDEVLEVVDEAAYEAKKRECYLAEFCYWNAMIQEENKYIEILLNRIIDAQDEEKKAKKRKRSKESTI